MNFVGTKLFHWIELFTLSYTEAKSLEKILRLNLRACPDGYTKYSCNMQIILPLGRRRCYTERCSGADACFKLFKLLSIPQVGKLSLCFFCFSKSDHSIDRASSAFMCLHPQIFH
jgi:hypothetical protein